MIDRLESSLSFYKQALDLRSQRQDVLASNIANADTPNYKARDFDFKGELDRALGNGAPGNANGGSLAMSKTAKGHIDGGSGGQGGLPGGPELKYRHASQPSLDGNTVEMDTERVEFMKNSVHYRANLKILGDQIKGLRGAMQPER